MVDDRRHRKVTSLHRKAQKEVNRRKFLRGSLSAVSVMAAGFSISGDRVLAAQSAKSMKKVPPAAIRIPPNLQTKSIGPYHRVFTPQGKKKLIQSITPMLDHLIKAAGINLNSSQKARLKQAFATGGQIKVSSKQASAFPTIVITIVDRIKLEM